MAKILIIDDDMNNRNILKARLESAGYQTAEADNGEDGITKAQNLRPDIIILDVMMPKVDGWLACHILKSDTRTKNIPVVMLTACARQMEELRGWESGADEYLTKPCDHKRLLEIIAGFLTPARSGL